MDLDRRLAMVAAAQHHVLDLPTLDALGVTRARRRTAERRARLHRCHPKVFSTVPPHALGLDGRCLAAQLAVGDGAWVTERAAAAMWGMTAGWVGDVVVVCERRARHGRGYRVRTAGRLDGPDVDVLRGVPVTSPARTLLECAATSPAATSPQARLEQLIDGALGRGLLDPEALAAVLDRAPGSRGVGVLQDLLGLGLTRSALERRFRRFVQRLELPLPLSGVVLEGYECDCYWPDNGLVVELDSWRFHRGRGAFERDHDRDLDLAAIGIRVLRLTYRQLTRRTSAVARVLRAALAES